MFLGVGRDGSSTPMKSLDNQKAVFKEAMIMAAGYLRKFLKKWWVDMKAQVGSFWSP